jgi:hypothetical protein
MSKRKRFPNGFTSWMETHHEVVEFITLVLNERGQINGVVGEVQDSQGTGGLYELAEQWTDEFEKKNKGREWDGEFFDEVGEFLHEKNKVN